ncbi:zinc transporter ZntB [Facilibium subflavum]|uniref:zinc transporter ZntB n=1 Tax=Facilibium subflavum TaxID=2219058 RepID=UPI000E654068|nr:zinc transporter ZntB [Facilibium subflavum]
MDTITSKSDKSSKTTDSGQYYRLDGQGGGAEISKQDIDLSQGLTWVRLTPSAVKGFLREYLPQTPHFVSELLSAHETRPRVTVYNDCLLATFRGVNLNKSAVPEDMIAIRLWIQKNVIITVQRRKLSSTQEIHQHLDQGTGPEDIGEFLEMLLTTLVDKASEIISTMDDSLDKIEDNTVINFTKVDRANLNEIRRRIVIMRRHLVPQRDAINRIPIDKLTWLDEKNLVHLREISDSCTRAVEDLNAEHERATIIHEELFAMVQEKINQKMYLLSIVAVIFMPLSFITGLLGINVGGIPGANFKYAFLIVCFLMIIIFIGQFIYLKHKKWF